jgi:hypothetical protein
VSDKSLSWRVTHAKRWQQLSRYSHVGFASEIVLTNRLSGLQAPDWYEKLERQHGELARQIAELSESALVRRVGELISLEGGKRAQALLLRG